MSDIKTLMTQQFEKTVIDIRLFKELKEFKVRFISKNDDHTKFFGGNLLGVNPVKFTPVDKNELLDAILNVNEDDIKEGARRLPSMKNEDWVRYTDPVNLSLLYLLHRVMNMPTDKTFSDHLKEEVLIDILLILQFKFISSVLSHYFKYPADEATALATYAILSKKYSIKQYGTWLNVLTARANDVISEQSIHNTTIKRFDDDDAIFYMISDIQGRIKEMVKKICEVFYEVRANEARILTTGTMIELNGKLVVRDITNEYNSSRRYIDEVVKERNRFIKPDLIKVIASGMHTMPEEVLFNTLTYIVDNYKDERVDALLYETLMHAFEVFNSDRRARHDLNNIVETISRLRALYMASRSSDPSILKMRELGESLVLSAVTGRSAAVVASTRTGLMLYIVLRTLAKNHYG